METLESRNQSPKNINVGGWFRFDRYEIRNGFVCPGTGAALSTYQPWELYQDARKGRGPATYGTLLRLLSDVETEGESEFQCGPVADKLVADWCAEHGLLGELPNSLLAASLQPRWEPETSAFERFAPRPRGGSEVRGERAALVPSQKRITRTSRGFSCSRTFGFAPRAPADAIAGGLVAAEHRPPSAWVTAVAMRGPGAGLVAPEEIAANYFPDVPPHERAQWECPVPLSAEFWQGYRESVSSVLHFARKLKLIIEAFRWFQEPKKHRGFCNGDRQAQEVFLQAAKRQLEELIEPCSPTLRLTGDQKVEQVWPCVSLVSSFGMMLLLDLQKPDRSWRGCETCGVLFLASSQPHHVRCSDKCRNDAKYQNKKARRQQAQAAAPNGKKAAPKRSRRVDA